MSATTHKNKSHPLNLPILLDLNNEIVKKYLKADNASKAQLRKLYNEGSLITMTCKDPKSIIPEPFNQYWRQLKHKATSTPIAWAICQSDKQHVVKLCTTNGTCVTTSTLRKHPCYKLWKQINENHGKQYKCDICSDIFASQSDLINHYKQHIGHPCLFCNQTFKFKSRLDNHMRMHTKERPFKCTYQNCKEAYTERSSLTVHMRYHTGEKPYACKRCGKRFSRSGSCSRHYRTGVCLRKKHKLQDPPKPPKPLVDDSTEAPEISETSDTDSVGTEGTWSGSVFVVPTKERRYMNHTNHFC